MAELSQEKLAKARKLFGNDVVSEVQMLVDLADTDSAYTQYEDMGQHLHAECVEFLYFEND